MSSDLHQPVSTAAGSSESRDRNAAVPMWLIILTFLLLYRGAVYFDQHGAWFDARVYEPYQTYADLESFQPKGEGLDLGRGKAVFESICGLCHGVDGQGKPGQAPPLAGSEWALGNPDRMIPIPLYGLSGVVSVKGQEFNLSMPAMGAGLSADDLAAVLTYIRSSWDNKAPAITPEQITAIKTKIGNHPQPFTAGELK